MKLFLIAASTLLFSSTALADFRWTIVGHHAFDDTPPINVVLQGDKIADDEDYCVEIATKLSEVVGDVKGPNADAEFRCVKTEAVVLPDMNEDLSKATPTSITFMGSYVSIKSTTSVKACESTAEELADLVGLNTWCGITPQKIVREGS